MQLVSLTLTLGLPASPPLRMPSLGVPLPTPLSLNTRPVMLALKALVNVQVMLAPLTMLVGAMLSTLPFKVPKVASGVALAASVQLADTGFAGQPAGEVSVMLAAVAAVPVIVAMPLLVATPGTVMVSFNWLSPLSAKLKALLPAPLAVVLTSWTLGPVPDDAEFVKVQAMTAPSAVAPELRRTDRAG